MSHKMLRPFIVKMSVLGYFPCAYNTSNLNPLVYYNYKIIVIIF